MRKESTSLALSLLLLIGCPYLSIDDLDARMDLDGDGVPRPEDCDDDDAGLGAPSTWYADVDGDGWGSSATTEACTQPSGFAAQDGDCNDNDSAVSPGATEICNGIDDDCNGITDGSESADATAWYQDGDGDGFGETATEVWNCSAPGADWVAEGTDCDDEHDVAYPGNDETWYDGIDGDCLGGDDYDQDGDGFQALGWGEDCDDADDWVNPDAEEACGDRIDNDCDGVEAACAFEGEQDLEQAPVVLLSAVDGDSAGYSWDGLGDIDGDGYDDLLIGAYTSDGSTSYVGSAYLVHGPVSGWHALDEVGLRLSGSQSGGYVGYDIAGAGDLTGDGVGDLLVTQGMIYSHGLGESVTVVHVVPGPFVRDLPLGDAGTYIHTPYHDNDIGMFMNVLGDAEVSGDGLDDAIVGYSISTAGLPNPGWVAVFDGPILQSRPLEDADALIQGEHDSDSIRPRDSGDLNADGVDDVAIGISSGSETNRAYVALGPLSGSCGAGELEVVLSGEREGDDFGSYVAVPGDVDGDGSDDLVVAAPAADRSGGTATPGAVYLFPGPLDASTRAEDFTAVIEGTEESMSLGASLAGAGDFNGDGRADIVVSGTSWVLCASTSRVPFVFGTPVEGTLATHDALAWACGRSGWGQDGSAGDFNGDGWDDLLLSIRSSDVEDGAVSIWFGGE